MNFLIGILVTLLWLVPGQSNPKEEKNTLETPGPVVRILLKSGAHFEGRVKSENEESLRLAVSFGEVIFDKSEIQNIDRGNKAVRVKPDVPEEKTVEPTPAPKKTPLGFRLPPPLPAEDKFTQKNLGASSSLPESNSSENAETKLEGVLTHYLWFLPENGPNRFLLGAVFFLGYLALFFFACKLAGIEEVSMGKGMLFSSVTFSLLLIQLQFTSSSWQQTFVYFAASVAVWFLLVKLVLRESLFRGLSVLAIFLFTALLGVLASELGYVMSHQGNLQ